MNIKWQLLPTEKLSPDRELTFLRETVPVVNSLQLPYLPIPSRRTLLLPPFNLKYVEMEDVFLQKIRVLVLRTAVSLIVMEDSVAMMDVVVLVVYAPLVSNV